MGPLPPLPHTIPDGFHGDTGLQIATANDEASLRAEVWLNRNNNTNRTLFLFIIRKPKRPFSCAANATLGLSLLASRQNQDTSP